MSGVVYKAGRRSRIQGFLAGLLYILCSPRLMVGQAQTAQVDRVPDSLHQLSSAFEALVKRVSPSVVQVLVTGIGPAEEDESGEAGLVLGRQRSVGSGAVIDPEGYIITNAHVVSGAQRVQVVLPSPLDEAAPIQSPLNARGRTADARIVGITHELDLALLKVEVKGLRALPIGDYNKLHQGEIVFAFGSPIGLRNSVTMGVVSAIARQPDPDSPLVYIQTDAPINPGNSGGPLVNADGELVGVNTFILSQSGGNEGLGFAIPSAIVSFAYPQLRRVGHLHRGEIGISVQAITPSLASGLGLARDWGVIVCDVLPGSPADSAGLKIQDVLLTLNGKPVDSVPIFTINFLMVNPGETMSVDVLRGLERVSLKIPVVERRQQADRLIDLVDPEKNLIRRLGILGVELDAKLVKMLPGLREASGVIVAAKAAGSGAAEKLLEVGDVIHGLNGMTVLSLDFLRSELHRLQPDAPVVLQIEREGRMQYVEFRVD
ncbi:MAG TPA: trypsin-like peptidase domain-containing protein [Terriglobia bacterium]|nr:trypsin-like peptidase domain-containing protein [Terriglobia bacterium]